jgi:hypothetical protein
VKVSPRRAADGFPLQRLLLLCAVIEKRLKLSLFSRDVYLNVVGGLRISEPSSDLAVSIAIVSSLVNMKIRPGLALVGEIGLAGEIRGVRGVDKRVAEAFKMGFTTIIVPKAGIDKKAFERLKSCSKPESNVDTNANPNSKSSSNFNHSKGPKGLGTVQCATLFEALTIALEVASFEDILNILRGSKRKTNFSYSNNSKPNPNTTSDKEKWSGNSGFVNNGKYANSDIRLNSPRANPNPNPNPNPNNSNDDNNNDNDNDDNSNDNDNDDNSNDGYFEKDNENESSIEEPDSDSYIDDSVEVDFSDEDTLNPFR